MEQLIREPKNKISANAVKVWRLNAFISEAVGLVILAVLLFLQHTYNWYEWIFYVLIFLIAITVIFGIYGIIIEPIYKQRTWRYEVDEQFIQLKSGAFKKEYFIVPMTKVQYVNTFQGPLLRRYGLYNIVIGTASSTHEIPAISEEEAFALREKIAVFAKITDEDNEKGD